MVIDFDFLTDSFLVGKFSSFQQSYPPFGYAVAAPTGAAHPATLAGARVDVLVLSTVLPTS